MTAKRRWEDEHWFWRGFQSVVFLYAQCGPCIAWREARRQKVHIKADKKRREDLRQQYPDHEHMAAQPAPYEVNPHWDEEIQLGPELPRKGGRKRGDTKASRETNRNGGMTHSDTADSSKSNLGPERSEKTGSWNSKNHQRADEEYEYIDERHEMVYAQPGLNRKGSSIGVSGQIADESEIQKPKRAYTLTTTMPPVNDLHPPIVSIVPTKREERAWMTAAPPSTAFMHGTVGVRTRPRSGMSKSKSRAERHGVRRKSSKRIARDECLNDESELYGVETDTALSVVQRSGHAAHALDMSSNSELSRANSFRLAQEKPSTSSPRKTKHRPAPLRLNSTASQASTDASITSDSRSEDRRGRSRTTYAPISRPKPRAKSSMNSYPITSSPLPSREVQATTSPLTPESTGTSPSSTLQPGRDSATPTPTSASPPRPTINDKYTPSTRKRTDTKTSTVWPEDMGLDLPPARDSALNSLEDIVDPNLLLTSKWVRSPVLETRSPLQAPTESGTLRKNELAFPAAWPGDKTADSPKKENAASRKRPSVRDQILMDVDTKGRRWSLGL